MWIEILLVLMVLLILLYVSGWLYRRRIYQQVDQLDQWKHEIEHRPIADELSRIKNLKLSGETETLFGRWRHDWDEIVTAELPDIEETLLDIEHYAANFRFISCNRLLEAAQERLAHIDEALTSLASEINELMDSEQQNRTKMTVVHEQLQEIKRLLQQKSMSLGVSYPVWLDKYKQALEWYREFQEEHEQGNYLHAREILQGIEQQCESLDEALDLCPRLIQAIEHDIPAKWKEAEAAVEEMVEKGYAVEHTGVRERLSLFYKTKAQAVSHMQNGDIAAMKAWQEKMEEELESVYRALEQEVENKRYVEKHIHLVGEREKQVFQLYFELKKEVTEFKQAYSWDEDWETKYKDIEQRFTDVERLAESLSAVERPSEGAEYVTLKEKLEKYFSQADELTAGVSTMREEIQTFRHDELEAKSEAQRLRRELSKVRSDLRKSNLPGLPGHVQSGLKLAEEALHEFQSTLEEIPLEMHRVKHHLEEARSQVQSIAQVAATVIELAVKAENYIQYGNRFRRQDETIRALLEDAEQAFREWEYHEALELAEAALDRADKNWREVDWSHYKTPM